MPPTFAMKISFRVGSVTSYFVMSLSLILANTFLATLSSAIFTMYSSFSLVIESTPFIFLSRAAVAANIIVARYRAAVNGLRSLFAGSPHISFRNSFICLFFGFIGRPRPRFYARVKRALRICKAQTLALPLRKGVKYNRRRAPRGAESKAG